jgi:phytoene synthase
LFAANEMRPALLGIYALQAEWQALLDPATESSAAHLKLAWWQDEMQRLSQGGGVHPISQYLCSLPRASAVAFAPLVDTLAAALIQISGVPLERGSDLAPQAYALCGKPLAVAASFAGGVFDRDTLDCLEALANAEYLSRGLFDYRREARAGRVPFAVDELLTAQIDNADLCADPTPERLRAYIKRQREQAHEYFQLAARRLPLQRRSQLRHLLVLAALGIKRLERDSSASRNLHLNDMLLAWSTARHANRYTRSQS